MDYFYYAVVKNFSDSGLVAMGTTCAGNNNIVGLFKPEVVIIQPCKTQKHMMQLVETWNKSFIANGSQKQAIWRSSALDGLNRDRV